MFIVSKRSFVVHTAVLLLCVIVMIYAFMGIQEGLTISSLVLCFVSSILTIMVFVFVLPTIKSLVIHYRAMRGRKAELHDFLRVKHRLIALLHAVPATPTIGDNMPTAGLLVDSGELLLIVRRPYGLKCVIIDHIGTKVVNGEEMDVRMFKSFTIPYSDYLPVMVHAFGGERMTSNKYDLDEVTYAWHAGDQLREVIDRLTGGDKPSPTVANSLNTATVDDVRELLGLMPESV